MRSTASPEWDFRDYDVVVCSCRQQQRTSLASGQTKCPNIGHAISIILMSDKWTHAVLFQIIIFMEHTCAQHGKQCTLCVFGLDAINAWHFKRRSFIERAWSFGALLMLARPVPATLKWMKSGRLPAPCPSLLTIRGGPLLNSHCARHISALPDNCV